MATYNERLQLESDICDLDRKIAEDGVLLRQKELALGYSDDNVETARTRYLLHRKNYLHMKTQADIVDLKEFRGTMQLLAVSRDEYTENQNRNGELRAGAARYRTAIEESTKRRDSLKRMLETFGEVIQFKPRAA